MDRVIFNYTFYNQYKSIKVNKRINYKYLFLMTGTIEGNKVFTDSEGIRKVRAFLNRKAHYKYNNFYRVKAGFYYYGIALHDNYFVIKDFGLLDRSKTA